MSDPATNESFEADLEQLSDIRQHASGGKYGPLGQGSVEFLLSFIDKLWAEYSRVNARLSAEPLALPPLNDEMRWILGRPKFSCVLLADALRRIGHVIRGKSEDEQAASIHWMLTLYLQHGTGWRDECEKLLATIRKPQQPVTKPAEPT